MPTTINKRSTTEIQDVKRLEVIRIYYELVKKGYPPEQTRRDLDLSLLEVEDFDFGVFNKAV